MKAATKRFYDKVSVRALPGAAGYTIALDGKNVMTPAKRVLALRTEALAHALAAEWERQPKMLRPDTMPLMKLISTSIDQVPTIRPTMVESMIRCLNADLACFRSSEEPQLMQREEQTFAPLLSWLADDVGLKLAVSHTFKLTHPSEAEPRARELLAQADDWELAALDMMTGASKSFVISLAVSHGRIDAESAAKAARTAEQYQIDEWGAVEAGHDLDDYNLKVDIASSAAFLQLYRAGWSR